MGALHKDYCGCYYTHCSQSFNIVDIYIFSMIFNKILQLHIINILLRYVGIYIASTLGVKESTSSMKLTFLDEVGTLLVYVWLKFCNMFSKIAIASETILVMKAPRVAESNILLHM
jgi:hypothetical protein